MPCTHPPEELIAVFEGTAFAKPDRKLCGLCGTLIYLAESRIEAPPIRGEGIFSG